MCDLFCFDEKWLDSILFDVERKHGCQVAVSDAGQLQSER
jgi:hypothetical protein